MGVKKAFFFQQHGVNVPIAKPVARTRPIALSSNLCKIMERMVIARLNYIIENKIENYAHIKLVSNPSEWILSYA